MLKHMCVGAYPHTGKRCRSRCAGQQVCWSICVFEHTHTQGRGAGLDVQVNRCVGAYVCWSITAGKRCRSRCAV